MNERADGTRIRPSFYGRQTYFPPEFRVDQRSCDNVRVRDRVFREEAESETACDHGQHPIVPVAAIDSFAVDATGVEHAVNDVVEFAEGTLHVLLSGETRYLDVIV